MQFISLSSRALLVAAACLTFTGFAACEDDSPAEEVADEMEEAGDEVGGAVEEATDELDD
mgnify:CR=1 FL=1